MPARLELIGAADLNGDAYLDNNIVIWRRLRAPLFRLTGPWPRLELVGLKAPSDSPLNLARFDDRHRMTTEKPICSSPTIFARSRTSHC